MIFDDNTYAGNNSNVVNITYKQNDMGYLVGTYAACMTTRYEPRQDQRGRSHRLRRRR
ncbi:MAG: BMP family ABC transporter substrate-binding protein [Oscillospiraceae bacterium]